MFCALCDAFLYICTCLSAKYSSFVLSVVFLLFLGAVAKSIVVSFVADMHAGGDRMIMCHRGYTGMRLSMGEGCWARAWRLAKA